MYKILIISILSLLALPLFSMQQIAFNDIHRDAQQYILAHALSQNNIVNSIRNLRSVNKNFYALLNKEYVMQGWVMIVLAKSLGITPRAIALHIVKAYKLNGQEAQGLLAKYPANKNFDQALYDAVWPGESEAMINLLKQNADVNAKYGQGTTALMHVAQNNRPPYGDISYEVIVKLLLTYGAEIDDQDEDGYTALILAARKGNSRVVKSLLKYGASVNTQSNIGNTALMLASWKGRKGIVELLLKYSADVNAQDRWGNTALIYAVSFGYKDIVELLLRAGADVTIKNKDSKTALNKAQEGFNNPWFSQEEEKAIYTEIGKILVKALARKRGVIRSALDSLPLPKEVIAAHIKSHI